jgi:hypothetical protein
MDKLFKNKIKNDYTLKVEEHKQIILPPVNNKTIPDPPPIEKKIPIPEIIQNIEFQNLKTNDEPIKYETELYQQIQAPSSQTNYNVIPQTAFNSDSSYFTNLATFTDLTVTNNLTVGNTTTTVNLVADNASITNHLNVSGNIIGNETLNITGNITGSADLNITGNITGSTNLNITGNITGSTNLNITGNITGSTNLNITGNITGQNLDITSNITTANLSVSSGEIFLIDDTGFNNKLHAIDQNLYFNNQLLAKANDIQNVSDWSLYPALQDVDMDLNGFFNTKKIKFNSSTTNILTTDTSNNLTYNGDIILTTASPTTGVSSLNTLSGNVNITSTNIATLTVAQVGQDIQLTVPTAAVVPPTKWSNYPAISDVQMSGYKLIDPNQTGITVDAGVNIAQIPTVLLNSKNGLGGLIDLVADNGYLGTSYGRINLTSNGGTNLGISTGGTINITSNCPSGIDGVIGGQINIIANTPTGITPTATAKILTSASGILSWAGATSPLTSQAGFNYLHGDLQVNLTAGTPPFFANDPLCVYIYGNNGTLMYGTQYMGKIRPYADLITNPVDLRIESYNNGFSTGYIVIDGAKSITMASSASINNVSTLNMTTGAITGVSTINGAAYPPLSSGVSSLNTLTGAITLTAGTNISLVPVGNDITINNTNPAPIIQVATTTPLISSTQNTIFILTSGTIQNFTSAELTLLDNGKIWYVKNGSTTDITIQHNGTFITGQTSTIHTNTGATNSSIQILYWSGTDLIMY